MNFIPNESSSKMAFIGTKQWRFGKLYNVDFQNFW